MIDNFAPLIDIAVNLSDKAFAKDLESVIERALDAGVSTLIVTGTDIPESEQALQLANKYADIYSTAGIHPHYAKDAPANYLNTLKDLLKEPKVRAVGETGLDFNRNFSAPEQQIKIFEQQLELACETGMPLLMHQRDAHPRFREMVETITVQADEEGRYTANSMYRAWQGWSFANKKKPSPWLTFLVLRMVKRLHNQNNQ